MNEKKIAILTEGGQNIGFGHISRCLSLYQAFEYKFQKPIFLINGDGSVNNILKNVDYELTNWLLKRNEIFNRLKNMDIVFIDSYLADIDFYKNLSKTVKFPIYIDDNNRLDYPKGIILNGNIHASYLNYSKKNDIKYLLGLKYTPMRKEFWDIPPKINSEKIKNIMVTFGGDDLRNMTAKILKLLVKFYPDFQKNIIVGGGFKNKSEIEKITDQNTNLIYSPDAEQMKNTMLNSDIAISAGGQTLYEFAATQTVPIVITVVDNQAKIVDLFRKIGFIEYAGWWNEENIEEKVLNSIKKLNNIKVRLNKIKEIPLEFSSKSIFNVVDFVLNLNQNH